MKVQTIKTILMWMLALILICGTSVFTSCKSDDDNPPREQDYTSVPLVILGIFAGLGIGLSALFQGRAAAAACDAQAETGQGLTNYFGALGIVETVAIFTMVFTIIALGKIA